MLEPTFSNSVTAAETQRLKEYSVTTNFALSASLLSSAIDLGRFFPPPGGDVEEEGEGGW
jgi:hypothetical protein